MTISDNYRIMAHAERSNITVAHVQKSRTVSDLLSDVRYTAISYLKFASISEN